MNPLFVLRRFSTAQQSLGLSVHRYVAPNANRWKLLLPGQRKFHERQGHAASAIGDDIYLVGGYHHNGEVLTLCEKFNTRSGTVESIRGMKRKRHGYAAVGVDGKLFVFGGSSPEDPTSAEVYDPAVGEWSLLLPPMQHEPRHKCSAVAVANTREMSAKTRVTTKPSSETKSKLLYVDAANFTGKFFYNKKPWNLEQAQAEVRKLCNAGTNGGWTMVVFLDQAIMTAEAIRKWRSRREREVKKGERNVPQGALRLVGDMFVRCGVEVRYSVEADNDDTIASYAQNDGASILSQDRDFLRYRNASYTLYKDFKIRRGKLDLIKQDGTKMPSWRDILQDPPLTGNCNPFRDCIQDKSYIRGSPSPLVQLGNLHILVRPLRAALYAHLGLEPVKEEFPVRQGNRCVWEKQVVEADETYSELLLSPSDAVITFDCDNRPPNDVSDQDWHKHQFALRCIVAEICCTVSGSTLLETLEPLLANIQTPSAQTKKNKKKKPRKQHTHYMKWREEQKTGETNQQKRERYLKLFPPNK